MSQSKWAASWLALLLCGPSGLPQQRADTVDPRQVEAAVHKAVEYLRPYARQARGEPRFRAPWVDASHADELVLFTFLRAGVPPSDPDFQKLFRIMLEREFTLKERRLVYCVAFQAMILEELDRVKFQDRIQLCAQWLLDTQCQNGQWNPEGTPSAVVEQLAAKLTSSPRDLPAALGPRPKVLKNVAVRKVHPGGIGGDNGASAFAALGLHACQQAGVDIPRDVLVKARQWWCESQAVHPRGSAGQGLGWCYCEKRNPKVTCGPAYGSATAGGVVALALYDRMLGLDPQKDRHIADGVAWLASQPSLTQEQDWFYTYLFSLGNVGLVLGTEQLGARRWYHEGASFLLATQRENGTWPLIDPPHEWLRLSDTCFSILFLNRAGLR